MAFAVENVAGNSAVGSASTLQISAFTITAANLLLVAATLGDDTPAASVVTGITANGAAMTAVASSGASDGIWASCVWYRKDTPAAGNIIASYSGVIDASTQKALHAVSFTDADLTLGTPSATNGTTANPSVTVADSASGDIVVACVANDNEGGNTVQANTLIFEVENLNSDTDHSSQYKTATGANTVMSWTQSGSGNGWAASGLAVSAGAGGPATITGTGAPSAQSATTAGTGERSITGAGTPAAQSATTAGTGTVGAVVTGTGAPAAQAATVAGTGERSVVGTGTPAAQSASTAGTGERSVTGSGTPAAQSATTAGEGAVASGILGSGIVVAQSASVAGTGERSITGSGVVVAQSAIVVGVGTGPATLSSEQPSGGWLFLNQYEAEQRRRRARARKRKELEEASEQIEDALDRNIALLMREQEAKDEKRKDLERLGSLAKQNADLEAARAYSERVATAFARAVTQGNYSALEALDRELRRASEEEEFLLTAIMMLLDD